MTALQGKVALVTGASRGIGRAIAEKLAQEGATVVVNYNQNANKAQEVLATIKANGGQAITLQADVTIPQQIQTMFEQVQQQLGQLDIVVSNAGGAFSFKPLAQTSEEEFDQTFALNTRGPFFVLQQAVRHLVDGGRIVVISTAGTAAPGANAAAYVGSKAALEQFAYALAKELGTRQITVNVVSAGVTQTDGLVAPVEMVQGLIAATPLGRLGQPADIAEVVSFVASEKGRWLTGQNIRATGGLV